MEYHKNSFPCLSTFFMSTVILLKVSSHDFEPTFIILVLIYRILPDQPKWKQITKSLTHNKHLSLIFVCNTSRFTAVSAVGSRRYSTHKFYMKEKISEIVRDFCDLLLKVKTFQKVSFIKPLLPKRWKHFWKINP